MKILLFALFAFFFLTNAMEVTDEDINSPLVSYLLAKVKRLEGKMMDKPNVRNIREVEKRSIDTNTSADVKNTKDCPQQVVTYIRWGNTTCPYGANTIYKGIAAGGRYDYKGSASNMLCLPPTNTIMRYPNNQGGQIPVDAVEYRVSGANNHAEYRNMPCALCEATGRGDKIMIPSHYECPNGWQKEYNGYIMAGHASYEGGSMYECIDEHLEQVPSTGGSESAHWLYTIYTTGSQVPSDSGYALSCVVYAQSE